MRLIHAILALLVVAVWGYNFVVIKLGLDEISPLILCFARFFLTSIPAVFFVKFPSVSWKMVGLYGLVMFALQFAFLFSGIYAGIPPGLTSLLLQTQVFFTILFAVLFLKEKLNRWQVIGALVSFSGIALVGINIQGNLPIQAVLLVVAAAISWGAGNIISKKIGKTDVISLVVWGSFIAWPPLLLFCFYFESPIDVFINLTQMSWLAFISIGYIAFLSTLFGYGVWSYLIYRYSLPTVAPFALMVPIFGMLSSVLFLNESLYLWKVIAGLLVILGLCINLFGPKIFTKKAR